MTNNNAELRQVLRSYVSTHKASPLQRRGGGAQHTQTYAVFDDAGTLEVRQDFHGYFLQRRARVTKRERRDAPSQYRALFAHVRATCNTIRRLITITLTLTAKTFYGCTYWSIWSWSYIRPPSHCAPPEQLVTNYNIRPSVYAMMLCRWSRQTFEERVTLLCTVRTDFNPFKRVSMTLQ